MRLAAPDGPCLMCGVFTRRCRPRPHPRPLRPGPQPRLRPCCPQPRSCCHRGRTRNQSPHRLDEARLGRVVLDQLAQARNLHIDGAIEHAVFTPARKLHELVARQRLAWVLQQDLEQGELTGGELDLLAIALQRACPQIDAHTAEDDELALGRGRARQGLRLAPHHRLDARDQLTRVEGLGHVVVRTHLQADDAIDVIALGGEHDDGQGVVRRAQAPADGQTILAGQHQVQHHEIEMLAVQCPVHHRRVAHGLHREALFQEVARQQLAQARVVVHQQYPKACFSVHGQIVTFKTLPYQCQRRPRLELTGNAS